MSVAPRSRAAVCVVRLFVRPLCEKGEDVASSPFSFHVDSRKQYPPTPVSQESSPMAMPPFHLAFPVLDLDARAFYGDLLGCTEGRSAPTGSTSISSATRSSRPRDAGGGGPGHTSAVDGDNVPVRHFGAILPGTPGTRWPTSCRPRVRVRHRAAYPLQGRDRRAGDDVLPRSQRQRAGVQDLQGYGQRLRALGADVSGGAFSSPGAELCPPIPPRDLPDRLRHPR